jgi:hypothetical protein
MPLIIPSNSISAGGYEVDNSCRFDGSSDYLRKTFIGTSTDSKKCTMSFWSKRTATGENNRFLTANITGSAFRDSFYFTAANEIQFFLNNANNGNLLTNRLFRDVSAWYHIFIVIDTTQGTAANRVKLYVNGTQETSFATESYPALNYDLTGFGNSVEHTIGADDSDGGSNEYYNGYMAEAVFVNGLALAPTDFGEFDEDSGIWKPIDVSGLTFGTNGFYLDFENSGSLGADVSGNGNDFTVNNLTAIDQTTDTPTNNFATLNPLDNYYASSTFSEGNCKIVTNGSAIIYNTSTIGFSSGKWYMETKVSGNVRYVVGVVRGVATANNNDNKLGNRSDGWGYDYRGLVENNGSDLGGSFASYTSGDIIGIYADLDNNELYFSKNGTLQNSGTGLTLTAGTYFFALGNNHLTESSTLEANFGNPTYTGTDQADVNSRGSFEYSPSAGTFDGTSKDFLSLCTKNLSEVLG